MSAYMETEFVEFKQFRATISEAAQVDSGTGSTAAITVINVGN